MNYIYQLGFVLFCFVAAYVRFHEAEQLELIVDTSGKQLEATIFVVLGIVGLVPIKAIKPLRKLTRNGVGWAALVGLIVICLLIPVWYADAIDALKLSKTGVARTATITRFEYKYRGSKHRSYTYTIDVDGKSYLLEFGSKQRIGKKVPVLVSPGPGSVVSSGHSKSAVVIFFDKAGPLPLFLILALVLGPLVGLPYVAYMRARAREEATRKQSVENSSSKPP